MQKQSNAKQINAKQRNAKQKQIIAKQRNAKPCKGKQSETPEIIIYDTFCLALPQSCESSFNNAFPTFLKEKEAPNWGCEGFIHFFEFQNHDIGALWQKLANMI